MSVVFIHGVPDPIGISNPVISELSRTHILALALPGFDSATPPSFWIDVYFDLPSCCHCWGHVQSDRISFGIDNQSHEPVLTDRHFGFEDLSPSGDNAL
jgi:hypothetical protein